MPPRPVEKLGAGGEREDVLVVVVEGWEGLRVEGGRGRVRLPAPPRPKGRVEDGVGAGSWIE